MDFSTIIWSCRYICDICGAGLKRKEHLERHKLGETLKDFQLITIFNLKLNIFQVIIQNVPTFVMFV